jgi:hypothetical protein
VVFAFGALLNAFAMVRPVYEVEQRLARMMSVSSEAPVLLLMFVLGLGIGPAVLLTAAAGASRLLSRPDRGSIGADVVNFAIALVPIGFGLWLAHYSFHLLTGVWTILPVTQSAAADLFGRAMLGNPLWGLAGMRAGAVFPLQIGFVMLGAFGSLAVAYGIAEREHPARPAAAIPWVVLVLVIAAAAIWVLSQPMEMRGSGFPG